MRIRAALPGLHSRLKASYFAVYFVSYFAVYFESYPRWLKREPGSTHLMKRTIPDNRYKAADREILPVAEDTAFDLAEEDFKLFCSQFLHA